MITLDEMLEQIRKESEIREASDTEWIVEAYNLIFGVDYDYTDFLD